MTPVEIVAQAIHNQGEDLSDCPYRLTCNNPDVPTEQCGGGCHDEPQCMTCAPTGGWPREVLAERYADLLPGDDDEPWGPSADAFLDALAALTALHEEGWRIVRTDPYARGEIAVGARDDEVVEIIEEWAP